MVEVIHVEHFSLPVCSFSIVIRVDIMIVNTVETDKLIIDDSPDVGWLDWLFRLMRHQITITSVGGSA